MKALVYHGPGRGRDTVADPTIIDPTDIVVRIVLQGSERDPSSNGHVAASVVAGAV